MTRKFVPTHALTALAALALLLAACAPAAAPNPQPTELPATHTPLPPTDAPDPTAEPTLDPDEPVTSPTQDPNITPDPNATPVLPPWAPQPGDEALERGGITLELSEVLLLESFPVQVQLHLEGARPTPCHALRVAVAEPDKQNQIMVEVYTVTDPGQACTQVLAPFTENINLGSFPSGDYAVYVNGALIAEITV